MPCQTPGAVVADAALAIRVTAADVFDCPCGGRRLETAQLLAHAAEALAAAVKKGEELSIFNPCRTAALELLRLRYPTGQFPRMGEDVREMTQVEPEAIGADLLRAIQL